MSLPEKLQKWLKGEGLSLHAATLLEGKELADSVLAALEELREKRSPTARTVYMDCTPSGFICLAVEKDALTATFTLIGFEPSYPLLRTAVAGVLASVGIVAGAELQAFLEEAEKTDLLNQPLVERVVARGQAAVPARPLSLKLLVQPFVRSPRYKQNEEGNVDYQDLNLFQNVLLHQPIAERVPAEPGRAGRNIYGDAIPAAEVHDHPIQHGTGVIFDENAARYYAAFPGFVLWNDNRLTVEKVYRIDGDVDLTVGHVNFVSDVVIRGDVPPDFSVRAGGRLDIGGAVSGAQLTAEGDLALDKGVLGQGKSQIKCNGRLTAKFLNDCRCEVAGDIVVNVEALNSTLHGLGKLIADRAVIIGGRVVILGGMDVGILGSDVGLRTEVFLGEDYRILNKTETLHHNIMETSEKIKSLLEYYEPDIETWQVPKENVPYAELEKLVEKFEDLLTLLNDLKLYTQEYELLHAKNRIEDRVAVCAVRRMIHPGTVFFGVGTTLEIKEPLKGPVEVVERKDSSGRSYISATRKEIKEGGA